MYIYDIKWLWNRWAQSLQEDYHTINPKWCQSNKNRFQRQILSWREGNTIPDSMCQGPQLCLVNCYHLVSHISLSMMSLIICIGISPSVRIASLFGSGLIKNNVGSPLTWNTSVLYKQAATHTVHQKAIVYLCLDQLQVDLVLSRM